MLQALSRREIAAGSLGIAAVALAACTPDDQKQLEEKLADIINQVQAAVKTACGLVPTANTVLAVLVVVAGTNTVVGVSATVIAQAVELIAKACPAPAPTGAQSSATVNGTTVPVVWY